VELPPPGVGPLPPELPEPPLPLGVEPPPVEVVPEDDPPVLEAPPDAAPGLAAFDGALDRFADGAVVPPPQPIARAKATTAHTAFPR
jgi:hypothetical protein